MFTMSRDHCGSQTSLWSRP